LAEKVGPLERPLKVTFRREYIDNYLPISDALPTDEDRHTGTATGLLSEETTKSRWGKLRGARMFGTFGGGGSSVAKPKAKPKVPASNKVAYAKSTRAVAGAGSIAGPGPNKFRSSARKLMLVNKLHGVGDDSAPHARIEADPRDREAGKHAWKFRDKVIVELDIIAPFKTDHSGHDYH